MHTNTPTETADPGSNAPTEPLDLKSVLQGLQWLPGNVSSTGRVRRNAILVDPNPVAVPVTSDPAPTFAFMDGIQSTVLVTRLAHRDVQLCYLAAGAMGADRRLITLEEEVVLLCSHLDSATVRAAAGRVPVVDIDESTPWEVPLAIAQEVDATRRRLERKVFDSTPPVHGSTLMVDGSLPRDGGRDDVAGVIKTATATDWLSDLTMIPTQEGWRSPVMLLPGERRGHRDVYTSFLRLRECTPRRPWTFSLVRVETYLREQLDPACARVLGERQPLRSPDPRSEIQMSSMFAAEQMLKARIPVHIRLA